MIWDFRSLIRRGLGRWPRDWRDLARKPIRPPGKTPKEEERRPEAGEQKPERDERWLKPPWQPPAGTADDWKK